MSDEPSKVLIPYNEKVLKGLLVPALWTIVEKTWPADGPRRGKYPKKDDMIKEIIKQRLGAPLETITQSSKQHPNTGQKLAALQKAQAEGTVKPDATFQMLKAANVARPLGQIEGAMVVSTCTNTSDTVTSAVAVEPHASAVPEKGGEESAVAVDSASAMGATGFTTTHASPTSFTDDTGFSPKVTSAELEERAEPGEDESDEDIEVDDPTVRNTLTSPPAGDLLRRPLLVRVEDIRVEGLDVRGKIDINVLVLDEDSDGSWFADVGDLVRLLQESPWRAAGFALLTNLDQDGWPMGLAYVTPDSTQVLLNEQRIVGKDLHVRFELHPIYRDSSTTALTDNRKREMSEDDNPIMNEGWAIASPDAEAQGDAGKPVHKRPRNQYERRVMLESDKVQIREFLRKMFKDLNGGDADGSDYLFFINTRSHPMSYKDIVRYYNIGGAFVLYYNNKRAFDLMGYLGHEVKKNHKICKEDLFSALGPKGMSASSGKNMVSLLTYAHYLGRHGLYEDAQAVALLESETSDSSALVLLSELKRIAEVKRLPRQLAEGFVTGYPFTLF